MSKSPYENYEVAREGLGMAGSAAGAATAFPNPMSGVQNAQLAYHMHQYGKSVSSLRLPACLPRSDLADFVTPYVGEERYGTRFSE